MSSENVWVGWETPEEWELELEVFQARNHPEVPEWARAVIQKLWRQYCAAGKIAALSVTEESA